MEVRSTFHVLFSLSLSLCWIRSLLCSLALVFIPVQFWSYTFCWQIPLRTVFYSSPLLFVCARACAHAGCFLTWRSREAPEMNWMVVARPVWDLSKSHCLSELPMFFMNSDRSGSFSQMKAVKAVFLLQHFLYTSEVCLNPTFMFTVYFCCPLPYETCSWLHVSKISC